MSSSVNQIAEEPIDWNAKDYSWMSHLAIARFWQKLAEDEARYGYPNQRTRRRREDPNYNGLVR